LILAYRPKKTSGPLSAQKNRPDLGCGHGLASHQTEPLFFSGRCIRDGCCRLRGFLSARRSIALTMPFRPRCYNIGPLRSCFRSPTVSNDRWYTVVRCYGGIRSYRGRIISMNLKLWVPYRQILGVGGVNMLESPIYQKIIQKLKNVGGCHLPTGMTPPPHIFQFLNKKFYPPVGRGVKI